MPKLYTRGGVTLVGLRIDVGEYPENRVVVIDGTPITDDKLRKRLAFTLELSMPEARALLNRLTAAIETVDARDGLNIETGE